MVGVAIAALRMVRTELLRGLRIATSAPRRVNGFVEDRFRSRRPETVECRLRLHTCGSLPQRISTAACAAPSLTLRTLNGAETMSQPSSQPVQSSTTAPHALDHDAERDESMTQQPSNVARNSAATRLSPGALSVAFGVATAVVILLFGGAMGTTGGMMGGGW